MIAFTGERGSGKDYFCELLQRECEVTRLSFSDELRILATKVFPFMELEYPPELKDKPLIHPENPNGLSPRDIWKTLDAVRQVDPAYFVHRFCEGQFHKYVKMVPKDTNLKAVHPSSFSIITDLRTPAEYAFLKEWDIPIIKIELEDRSGLTPDPFEEFVRQFKDYQARFVHGKQGEAGFLDFWKQFLQTYN